jgi:hypothetical protein
MRRSGIQNALLTLFLACTLPLLSFSQTVTGIWSGYFISDNGETYKLEFQVKQNPTLSVTGVSYSYLDVRFYGKATMTGSFIKNSNNFRIREIRTVEVKNSTFGGTCIMNYDLTYSREGKEEFLIGTYLGKPETKGENPYDWGDCGGGKVHLRKVKTSSFYVEPFLRNIPRKTSPPPANNNNTSRPVAPPPVVKKTTPKTNNSTVKSNNTPRTTAPERTTAPQRQNNPGLAKTRDSSLVKLPDVKKEIAVVKPPVVTPDVLKNRQNELMKSLIVKSQDVTVKLYDNGEIDDDTISVYLDKKLVLSSKRLTGSPLTIKLKMDNANPDHELVMVAENLGRIPPNTSLMVVEAGDQRFDVRITSTEQKNAVVRFRYQP